MFWTDNPNFGHRSKILHYFTKGFYVIVFKLKMDAYSTDTVYNWNMHMFNTPGYININLFHNFGGGKKERNAYKI